MFKHDFEWLTSNTHVAHPFVEPIEIFSSKMMPLSDMIADIFVAHAGSSAGAVYLSELSDPLASTVHVKFTFKDGSVAYESSTGTGREFGPWYIIEWNDGDGSARLLIDNRELDINLQEYTTLYPERTKPAEDFSWPIEPDAEIVTSCVQHTTPSVTKIMPILGAFDFSFEGTVELEAGYNIDLSVEEDGIGIDPTPYRGKRYVTINATPGAGLGKVPACDQDLRLLTVNNVGPDDQGDLKLSAEDCYHMHVPLSSTFIPKAIWSPMTGTAVVEGVEGKYFGPRYTQALVNSCEPCCDCADYVQVYDEMLRETYTAAKAASTNLYTALDGYKELISGMDEMYECRSGVSIQLRLKAFPGWFIGAQVVINNNTGCPLAGPIDVTIVFNPEFGDEVADPSLLITYPNFKNGKITAFHQQNGPTEADRSISVSGVCWPVASYSVSSEIHGASSVDLATSVFFGRDSGRSAGATVGVFAYGSTADGESFGVSGSVQLEGPLNREDADECS